MRIIDIGHVGIYSTDPKELLQIGSNLAFHVGSTNDFIGYNVYVDGSNNQERINTGYSSIIDFRSTGELKLGIGGTGAQDAAVNFTDATGVFNGLILDLDGSGKGIYSFGADGPSTETRLLVRGHNTNSTTNVLLLQNSSDAQLMKVRNDGGVLIGSGTMNTVLTSSSLQVKGDVIIGNFANTDSHGFTYALHVDGIVIAREVAVLAAEWADHVFSENYDLMELSKVESFIAANHHLPGIPSHEEVMQNGFHLGEMQAILLEKIEELTLHVIRLEKSNRILLTEIL